MLEAGPGKTGRPDFRGDAGNVAYGARASVLPDC